MLTHTLFHKSAQFLANLLYPPYCVNCKAADSWLCEDCRQKIPFIVPPVCTRCGTPTPSGLPAECEQCRRNPLQHIDAIRSAAYFEDNPMRPAIHFLKYRNHKAVAAVLGQILANTCNRYQLAADVIMPVPLHPSRLRERGYNQSELLAKTMGRLLDLPVNTTILHRLKKTKSQMKLAAAERRQNVAGAFGCRSKQYTGQIVLLIDDVCTTGSTLDACAWALKQSGVARVWGVTLAKAH